MKRPVAALFALTIGVGVATAQQSDVCHSAIGQLAVGFALPQVEKAVATDHKLSVVVVGAGSSSLPASDPKGWERAYPGRLRAALAAKFPDVTIDVTVDVKSRRTTADMLPSLGRVLDQAKPSLVVWETGTVDAMRNTDLDDFGRQLEKGLDLVRDAKADTILINMQYSPRTESMIALRGYAENMRWLSLQREVPLFDRFAIMRTWSELGSFDFFTATKKLDMAEKVHDCIAQLLAELVYETVRHDKPVHIVR
jgi:hypothetical protein